MGQLDSASISALPVTSDTCLHPAGALDVCQEPCSRRLRCGHRCWGICGESCPQLCNTCQPEQFQCHVSAALDTATDLCFAGNEIEAIRQQPIFVELLCSHVFEVRVLDKILVGRGDSKVPNKGGRGLCVGEENVIECEETWMDAGEPNDAGDGGVCAAGADTGTGFEATTVPACPICSRTIMGTYRYSDLVRSSLKHLEPAHLRA